METSLSLVFKNAEGRTTTFSLADPRADITEAEVAQVMQTIIARNIFATSGGDVVEAVAARITSREVTELDISAA
jgi:hypothetical protein